MMRRHVAELIVALLLHGLCMLPRVAGHGMMIYPGSRNFNQYMQGSDWCPHCLNAGGAAAVSKGGQLTWPTGTHGYCGDRAGEQKWDVAGPIQATYTSGQIINIDFIITENHLGRISMELCDIDAQPGDGKCAQLNRADGKGALWYLPFIDKWSGGNNGKESKLLYSDGSFGWYTLPELTSQDGCTSMGMCNHYKDMVVYRTQWQLPQERNCRRCKLQWQYFTAHNCWPPCAKENKDEVTCQNTQAYGTCGTPGTQYPEYFWNCADVTVLPANATQPPEVRRRRQRQATQPSAAAGSTAINLILEPAQTAADGAAAPEGKFNVPNMLKQHVAPLTTQKGGESHAIDPTGNEITSAAGDEPPALERVTARVQRENRRRLRPQQQKDLPPWESKIKVSTAAFGVPTVVRMSGAGWRAMQLVRPDHLLN